MVLDLAIFGMEPSCGCAAADLGTKLGALRGQARKRRAVVDRLFALRESPWLSILIPVQLRVRSGLVEAHSSARARST
jgi:hypothetical protein